MLQPLHSRRLRFFAHCASCVYARDSLSEERVGNLISPDELFRLFVFQHNGLRTTRFCSATLTLARDNFPKFTALEHVVLKIRQIINLVTGKLFLVYFKSSFQNKRVQNCNLIADFNGDFELNWGIFESKCSRKARFYCSQALFNRMKEKNAY
jgi:hypothetical protein